MNVIRKLRVLRVVMATWGKIEKLLRQRKGDGMRIRLSTNLIVQILAFIVQGLNQLTSIVPDDTKPVVLAVVAILQGVVALLAHYSNPDATPVATAYLKKKRNVA